MGVGHVRVIVDEVHVLVLVAMRFAHRIARPV
jgi:hypothetical protein